MCNIEYFICQRFFVKDYQDYNCNNSKIEELVSVDCLLFPYSERREYNKKIKLEENEQILAVLNIEKGKEIPILNDFEFCGFDLEESGISTLINCFPNLLDGIYPCEKLNQYGLLDNLKDAEMLQEQLPMHYPDEPHAYCEIYGIWRKLNIR